jgi:hypothetical protein
VRKIEIRNQKSETGTVIVGKRCGVRQLAAALLQASLLAVQL